MKFYSHRSRVMLRKIPYILFVFILLFFSGCTGIVKQNKSVATLLKTEEASKEQLLKEINRFSELKAINASARLKFEDNSFASFGSKEVFRAADGQVVVQRPGKILLKVKAFGFDIAQMTSDGAQFRVAVLQDGGSGKNKVFVVGSNDADYSVLQKKLSESNLGGADESFKKNASAFANLRPQHFTDAVLVNPVDPEKLYTRSSIFQEENDQSQSNKSAIKRVVRGYYLIDEFIKGASGELNIKRRFWFDRVGSIRLARQQIFDANGEIDTDIVYGLEGQLGDKSELGSLPMRITVTRPKDKYTMSITYDTANNLTVGKFYPDTAFVLENSWNLPEVNLDQKLLEAKQAQAAKRP